MTQEPPKFQTLLLETDGPVATLTLNRADALNAIDVAMACDLLRAAQWIETCDAVRVVLLRGTGKAFCAGGDIGMFTGEPDTVRATLSDLFTPLNDFIARIARMDKVWLAQVHGVAAGAGANLAFAGDIVIAKESANFIQSFCKLGLIPDTGYTRARMQRLYGSTERAAVPAAVVRARSAGEQGADYRAFERAEPCANDAFRFSGLPDGSWFLISPVKAGDDIVVLMKRVQTRGGRMINVTLGS